jgi:S-adenosylmethionine:tRNA ribosyltransferase-isomerase
VFDLPSVLRPGDRLVLNDTKVIPARLAGVRARAGAEGVTEARIEATLLEPLASGEWRALLKPLKKVRDGEEIVFSPRLSAVVAGREEGTARLAFNLKGEDFDAALAEAGDMPLPPYIAAAPSGGRAGQGRLPDRLGEAGRGRGRADGVAPLRRRRCSRRCAPAASASRM